MASAQNQDIDNDQELFTPPYLAPGRAGPEDEVHELLQKVSASAYLNPAVREFLKDPVQKTLFLELFARQVNLIKARCQAFEECHVTVFDKVLLKLTENGNNLDWDAAQEFFCEEYLGISRNCGRKQATQIMDQNIVLKAILARGKAWSVTWVVVNREWHPSPRRTPSYTVSSFEPRCRISGEIFFLDDVQQRRP